VPHAGLIVLLPVLPGAENALRACLNHWGNRIRKVHLDSGTPFVDLLASPSIHFARFALVPDPLRGPDRFRLLVATDFDGSLTAHLAELHARTHHPEALWGRLEGYGGPDDFADFLLRHAVHPGAYYRAFPTTTLPCIRAATSLRSAFESALDAPGGHRTWQAWPDLRDLILWSQNLGQALLHPVRFLARIPGTLCDAARLLQQMGWRNTLQAARRINATLNRVPWIRVFNQLLRNHPTPPPHPYSEACPQTPALPTPTDFPPEDAIHQNQLTLITEVRPQDRDLLKAVLGVIDFYARRLASEGSLVGIGTIHTVRWALIDQDTRLLMVSNYDGSWENYIDEFAEMILSGLDALWTSAPNFPKAGAQDVEALKEFLRHHQVTASVFYSAYPYESVLNLTQALSFHRTFGWLLRPRLSSPCSDASAKPTSHVCSPEARPPLGR